MRYTISHYYYERPGDEYSGEASRKLINLSIESSLNSNVSAERLSSTWYELVIRSHKFGIRSRIGFLLGLATLTIALNLFGSANLTSPERMLASLIVIVCALPSWLW